MQKSQSTSGENSGWCVCAEDCWWGGMLVGRGNMLYGNCCMATLNGNGYTANCVCRHQAGCVYWHQAGYVHWHQAGHVHWHQANSIPACSLSTWCCYAQSHGAWPLLVWLPLKQTPPPFHHCDQHHVKTGVNLKTKSNTALNGMLMTTKAASNAAIQQCKNAHL